MSDDRVPSNLDEPMNAPLAALAAEVRAATAEPPAAREDFDALFARATAGDAAPLDAPAPAASVVPFRRRALTVGAVLAPLALAAGVFLVVRKEPATPPVVVAAPPTYAPVGVVAPHGAAGLTLSGGAATAGAPLREGTTLATAGRASFVRPGKVRWLLEGATGRGAAAATVVEGKEALRVALEQGAIEAEVTPVPRGEAFSVDVAGTRVAVHGTHLRVARVGDTITIDLSHGVIAIGEPGRARVEGPEIVAPAHIEFPVGHPEQKVVRTTDLRRPELFDDAGDLVTPPVDEPVAAIPLVSPKEARRALLDAVDACARSGRAGAVPTASAAVEITVSSTASLSFAEDGKLKAARFYPPLRPDVQSCVSSKMAGVAVKTDAPLSVPVQFTYR